MSPWSTASAAAASVSASIPLVGDEDAPAASSKTPPLLLVPKDRVLVQRGFLPFEGAKRMYGVAVGSPVGTHYAYDCETGALLLAWRGAFIDVAEMWEGRSFNQTARPAGEARLTLNLRPVWALFPDRLLEYPKAWPRNPDALYSSQGYEIDPDGIPVFLAMLSEMTIRDRIAPSADGKELRRTLTCGGQMSLWETWVLLAEADEITPVEGGFTVGSKGWKLGWPANSPHRPIVRKAEDQQQLVLHLAKSTFTQPITYTLGW